VDSIAVLDFGGQYAHLIANRVRRLGVFSEILDGDTPASKLKSYKGIILSGGPSSVSAPSAILVEKEVFDLGIPVLGICYGHQLINHVLGGVVDKGATREYGPAQVMISESVDIFEGISGEISVWMSHFDEVKKLADGFRAIGSSDLCPYTAVINDEKKIYGVQFHPEVTHTPQGMRILENFVRICDAERSWNLDVFLENEIESIKKFVQDKKVFMLVSGGVDSTVAFVLLEKALGKDRVYGLLVDTGLMRYNEVALISDALKKVGFDNLHVQDASETFLSRLEGKIDPEEKRKIIGDTFLDIKDEVAQKLGLSNDEWIMGQGTIYPDTIETGGTKHAHTIKTHHNRVDAVQKLIAEGKVIEPLKDLYKDEVRKVGEILGLPKELVWRKPFPGPGLGVRILCADQPEILPNKKDLIEQIKKGAENYMVDILPIRSVGVQGDERTYRHCAALFGSLPHWKELDMVASRLINTLAEVNRCVYCLAGEPAELTLKPGGITQDRIEILQWADHLVEQELRYEEVWGKIWQLPVVLIPCGSDGKESIVLRPVDSQEAMTANFSHIDPIKAKEIANVLLNDSKLKDHISHVFFDLTHKPPGTIEWE
jgi:GMP synthase (glutamine-hydrolysing)